jgi:formiminotetrahydrofolate cyclodeaminase
MKISQWSFTKICSQTAGENLVPGGGAVSALSGALAASLTARVAGLSLGKDKSQSIKKKLEEIKKDSRLLAEEFLVLASRDCRAYKAFCQQKKDPKAIEKIIKIPLEIARKALKVFESALSLAEKGNQKLAADARCALEMATASFYGALEIVRFNLGLVKDSDRENEIRDEIEKLLVEMTGLQK